MPKWVQHKSGQGKKWEVDAVHLESYAVKRSATSVSRFLLPIEEYALTDPLEQWETCTRDYAHITDDAMRVAFRVPPGCRFQWSEKDHDAIVIQRKVEP